MGEKQKVSKKWLLAFFAFACAVFLYPQGAEQAPESAPDNPETRIILNAPGPGDETANTPPVIRESFPFVRMIVVLALIAAAAFGIMKFFKRGLTSAYTADPFLRRAASLTLSPGKTVHVVTLNESAFLVGVTESGMSLIGKVEDKELVDAMNLHAEEANAGQARRSFADLLATFTGRRKPAPPGTPGNGRAGATAGETEAFSAAFADTASVIREQKSRLSGFRGETR